MRELDLWRMSQDAIRTFGRVETQERKQLCVTIELPRVDADHDGHRDRNVSRVDAGRYKARRVYSPAHHRELFKLQDIPDAADIELHIACLPRDLKGCIGLGKEFGPVQYPDMAKAEPGVTHSHDAFVGFMAFMDGVDEFWLTIHDVPAAP